MATQAAFNLIIRIAKQDSAWIYHVFEAQEGAVSYSTLSDSERLGIPRLSPEGRETCDLELTVPVGFLTQIQDILQQLIDSGIWIYEVHAATLEKT